MKHKYTNSEISLTHIYAALKTVDEIEKLWRAVLWFERADYHVYGHTAEWILSGDPPYAVEAREIQLNNSGEPEEIGILDGSTEPPIRFFRFHYRLGKRLYRALKPVMDDPASNRSKSRGTRRGNVKAKDKRLIYSRDNKKCQFCDQQQTIRIDHVIPLSFGGCNDVWNLQLLCKRCNQKKLNYLHPEAMRLAIKRLETIIKTEGDV
ncbi:MAG TPA: HNH endonuclease [Balneolaceae bacterium]